MDALCLVTPSFVYPVIPSLKYKFNRIHQDTNRGSFRLQQNCFQTRFQSQLSLQKKLSNPIPISASLSNTSFWKDTSILILGATISSKLPAQHKLASAIGSSCIAFLLGILACNTGILPTTSPIYDLIWTMGVPIAVCALLLRSPIKSSRPRASFTLAFILGAVGTLLGSFIAAKCTAVPRSIAWKLAAVFCATYIGGTVNFTATASAVNLSSEILSAALCADMVLMAIYFCVLFLIARLVPTEKQNDKHPKLSTNFDQNDETNEEIGEEKNDLLSFGTVLCVSSVVCCIGSLFEWISGGLILFASGFSLILVFFSDLFLSKFPRFAKPALNFRHWCDVLSEFIMLLFFISLGSSSNFQYLLQSSPGIILFGFIVLLIHALVMAIGGYVFRIPLRELLIASNANVGGSATAAGMAVSLKWTDLVGPSVIVGTLGYASATFIGLALGSFLYRT